MKYTQAHSRNAVAAKTRARMARANNSAAPQPRRRAPAPRRTRAAITVQIRDNLVGDSLTLNLHKSAWRNHWVCEQGAYSTAQLVAAYKHILQSAADRAQ